MLLDTSIEEHYHFKVFCYIIFCNGRHFEFAGNFRSRMLFHNISYVFVLILFVLNFNVLLTKKEYVFFLDWRRDLSYWNDETFVDIFIGLLQEIVICWCLKDFSQSNRGHLTAITTLKRKSREEIIPGIIEYI